jgi:Concanavalin A-like lectin/glucanases superfamily
MKKSIYFFLFILIFCSGCSTDNINSPITGNKLTGEIVLNIDKVNAPANVANIIAILTNANYDTLKGYMNLLSDTTAGISFLNVAVGTWNLVVLAKDTNGTTIYKGQTSLMVNQGLTTDVYLTLTPVGNGTGNITITVGWGTNPLGNAIYLDGTTGYVEIPQSNSILSIDTAITVEAWIKPAEQYYNPVFTLGQDYGIEFAEGLYPGLLLNGVSAPNANLYWGRIMIPYLVAADQWTHLAISYSQSTGINVYINGNLIYHTSATGSIICETSLSPRIGSRVDPTGTIYFNGGIDDLRLWGIVRTQSEIVQNFNKELTGNEYGLEAYWKFDETPGINNTIHDSSPNHNDGTIHGGISITNHF